MTSVNRNKFDGSIDHSSLTYFIYFTKFIYEIS